MKKIMMVTVAVLATVAFAQTETVVKMPGIQKIDMENLLDVPIGSTLLDTGIKRVTQEEDPKKNVERELVVRGFATAKRQMAVCTCLHTKGDTLRAGFATPK